MQIEISEILQYGWGLLSLAFLHFHRELRSVKGTLSDREDVIHHHDKELAVLEAMIKTQSSQMTEIKDALKRIEDQLRGKADR